MIKSNLVPIIHDKMDILFVPLNPPKESNKNQHYFSSNNSFWDVLFESGLITNKVSNPKPNTLNNDLYPDDLIFRQSKFNYKTAIFGVHDLVPELVETNSNYVRTSENNVEHILNHTKTEKINVICLMHCRVRRSFKQHITSTKKYGIVGKNDDTIIYSVPFPHGSHITKKEIISEYSNLKNQFLK